VYPAVEAIAQSAELSTASVCGVLDVSRSAYYAWRSGGPSPRQQRDQELTPLVRALFWKHRRRYGARRIAEDLADLGETCSPRRVAKLLKNQGLQAIQPKSFVPKTTDSRHGLGYSPNLLLETPPTTSINQLWVGDITYVPLRGGQFSYLAMLMDRHSRYLVGWRLAEVLTDELVLPALRMAIRDRAPPKLSRTWSEIRADLTRPRFAAMTSRRRVAPALEPGLAARRHWPPASCRRRPAPSRSGLRRRAAQTCP
jgi:putative transposase